MWLERPPDSEVDWTNMYIIPALALVCCWKGSNCVFFFEQFYEWLYFNGMFFSLPCCWECGTIGLNDYS